MQNLEEATGAITLGRRHLWLASEGFALSDARTGYMESPACPVPPTGRFTRLRGLKRAKPSQDAPTTLSSRSPDGSPARRAASLCIFQSTGPGKPSSVAPWHDCEPCHSQPDGNAGVNADGDLTHLPDYPTASQTCARLVPERLWLHAILTISPSIATAGRYHRSCVATSRRPHPLCWNQARPVRLPLPIIPGVNATAHRFGGFGFRVSRASETGSRWHLPESSPALRNVLHQYALSRSRSTKCRRQRPQP